MFGVEFVVVVVVVVVCWGGGLNEEDVVKGTQTLQKVGEEAVTGNAEDGTLKDFHDVFQGSSCYGLSF